MAGYLPPVVIDVIGRDTEFIKTITKDQALLKTFGNSEGNAKIGADDTPFMSKLTAAKTELLSFTKDLKQARLGANAAPFWADIRRLRAEMGAMSPLDIRVDANTAAALAKIDALRGALALSSVDRMSPTLVPAGGGGGRGGVLGFLGGMFAGGAGGGKKGPGMASILGFGANAGLFGMAGIGSIAGMAGLGAEHAIMTGVGLAGSAAGGMLGGGLLAAGSAGVMGVGMGTDMAGMGQAANDAKQYSAALNNLNQAIAVYGPASQQAAAATAQMKYTLAGMPTAAQGAIVALVNTKNQFKALFDQATGPAEKVGAQILQQAMQVGEKFLPTIGRYAAQNMGIIQSDLQPLFSWLKGPGLSAFNELEHVFQQNLPTAMHAFDQGVELVTRTLAYLAPQTGGLTRAIDTLVTKFNGGGWTQWEVGIQKLIGDFRQWEGLIKIAAADIYQLFHNDAGTGSSIVASLTQMLNKLHAWETSTSGKASLHNIFTAHKQEVDQLLKLIPPLVGVFGKLELAISPSMTRALTLLVRGVNDLLKIPIAGKLAAWGLGFGLLAKRMSFLPLLSSFKRELAGIGTGASGLGKVVHAFGLIGSSMSKIAGGEGIVASLKGMVTGLRNLGVAGGEAAAGEDAAAASTGILDVALGLLSTVGILAVIVGLYELITHWKTVWKAVESAAKVVWGWLKTAWHATVSALKAAWDTVSGALKSAWDASWNAVKSAGKKAWDAVSKGATGLWRDLGHIWGSISSDATKIWNAIVSFIEKIPGRIVSGLSSLGKDLLDLATSAWGKFKSGATTVAGDLLKFVSGIPHKILSALGNVGTLLFDAGKSIVQGLINGIESMAGGVLGAIGHLIPGGKAVGGVLSHVPVVGGLLSHLAEGGIVTKPTLAMIGEAGYPELVLPLKQGLGALHGGVSPLPQGLSGGGGGLGGGAFAPVYNVTIQAGPGTNASSLTGPLKQLFAEHDRELISKLRSGTAYS